MDISEIKPYYKNAKKHDKKQIKQVADSIKRFGFVQPIVIDKNNEVVIGHCRLEAAKMLELKDVPTISVENLTDKEVQALRLADNKLNESAWDMNLVIDDLKGLDTELLDLTGFSRDLIIEGNEQDDVIPDNAPVVAKLGDRWQLGRHRVMCGDSTKKDDVARLMGDKKADMVFTDPPYGIGYKDTKGKHKEIAGDDSLLNINNLLLITLENNCPTYICCNWKSYPTFDRVMTTYGREPKSCIVWDKEVRIQNLDKYYKQHEFILYYGLFGGQKTLRGDVWRMKRQVRNDHPTAKPVELIETAITDSVLEDNIVQDLFLGSGSTLIACEKTNRICYGMELDPKYVDVIIARWETYTGLKAKKI